MSRLFEHDAKVLFPRQVSQFRVDSPYRLLLRLPGSPQAMPSVVVTKALIPANRRAKEWLSRLRGRPCAVGASRAALLASLIVCVRAIRLFASHASILEDDHPNTPEQSLRESRPPTHLGHQLLGEHR